MSQSYVQSYGYVWIIFSFQVGNSTQRKLINKSQIQFYCMQWTLSNNRWGLWKWFVKSAYVFRVMHPFPRYNNLTSSSQLLRTVKAREGLALLGSKASHAGAEHRDSRGEDSYPALGLGHAALKWREARLGVCAWWSSGSWLQLKANDCDLRTKSRVNCFALGLFLCNLPPQPSSVCTNPPAQPALSETWPLYTSLHAGSM